MLRFRFGVFFLAVLFPSISLVAQEKPPPAAESVAALAHGVFDALQAGSFAAMEHLLPVERDFMELIDLQAAQDPNLPEERIAEVRAEVPTMVKETRDKLLAEFGDVRSTSREIDWASVRMTRVVITVRDPDSYEEREVDDSTLESEGLRAADVHILVDTGDRVREIDFQDCFKTTRGWLIMEKLGMYQYDGN